LATADGLAPAVIIDPVTIEPAIESCSKRL
jgi:hypothetical protein